MEYLKILSVLYFSSTAEGFQIVWDNSVDFDFNDFHVSSRYDDVRMPNSFFIYPDGSFLQDEKTGAVHVRFSPDPNLRTRVAKQQPIESLLSIPLTIILTDPGTPVTPRKHSSCNATPDRTKWCGAGNIAANGSDFGTHRDTDKCCRNHDYCPDIIEGYQTKHNLTNPSFYTRLNCACDMEFYKCLKSVNSRTSKQVGHVYFTALGTECYKEEYPISGCNRYTYFPRQKCLDYTFDTTKPKEYQWFDIPNF